MLRCPWDEVRSALHALAAAAPDIAAVQVAYLDPQTGADCQAILGHSALMLRPGGTLRLPARSPALVPDQIEGDAEVAVEAQRFVLDTADTCCLPGYAAATLTNRSADEPAFLFLADEAPLHRKLGVYELRG